MYHNRDSYISIITLSKNAYSLRDPCFPASANETSRNDVIRGRYRIYVH